MTWLFDCMRERIRGLVAALGCSPPAPVPAPIVLARFVEDEPNVLDGAHVYLVGGRDPIYAAMVCPCGCGGTLRMNLRPEAEPCWRLSASETGAATLQPSVWRDEGCRSHFFLRAGQIVWCDSL